MLPEQADHYSYNHRHSGLGDDDNTSMQTISTTSSISSTTTTTTDSSFRLLQYHHKIKQEPKQHQQPLSIQDFRILKPIGAGDIGKVYLCQLINNTDDEVNNNYYAIKVMDRDVLELKNKTHRAETEKETLKLLQHPFLPKLIAHFNASSRFSCNVIDYCSGGDLHSLQHRQPNNKFSLSTARFYAAEVLLALEYLHMLGIVYRDLKPENILIRSDGHIMLTDFDLCLLSSSTPTLESTTEFNNQKTSCIPNYFRRIQTTKSTSAFVAEPITARSTSFVGTHEYVAPEVASGKEHGSAVDWWAFGIFIYEMLYGRTPFVGESNETTLRHIVKMTLTFPEDGGVMMTSAEMKARDLMVKLLNKDVASRLGTKKGAADIKSHAFFKGVNFALIRWSKPPEIPGKGSFGRRVRREAFDCF